MKKKSGEKSISAKKKETMSLSVKEGAAVSVMIGAGHSFIIPYALAIGAGNLAIGFLNSFIGLVGPLTQLKSTRLMEKYPRKKIVFYAILIQALMWMPIMLLGLLFFRDIFTQYLPFLLIIFYSLHIGAGALASPIWFSWMGDIVPAKNRGKYFSFRNRVVRFVTVVSMLAAGFFLDYFKTGGFVLLGFSVLFSFAMIFRLYSIYLFSKHYDPGIKLKKGYYFSFFDFLKHSRENNFGRFVIFVGAIFFAMSIATPFFAVYMLEELGFSYVWYTLIILAPVVLSLFSLSFWGKISDKYGNRLVIFIAALSAPIYPLLWLFSTSKIYLLIVPPILAGLFWGGFNLATINFVYDSAKKEHRSLCLAYLHVLMGVGIFAGSILGGVIAKYGSVEYFNDLLNLGFGNIFLYIFLFSAFARFLVVVVLLHRIKEVRDTKLPPILTEELKHLENFEAGMTHFNGSMFHYLDVGDIGKEDINKVGRVFR
ncbi:hypothetical protein CMI46_01625 [Candidatus Pacearchaeota archaeon]|nr:hypothetical protein [Candidatus Pacearchaeota archaeon]|tara:strand:+ start:5478 stop:6923 length:1446 start_codon:yes stop_codon:yes gene_type:complete